MSKSENFYNRDFVDIFADDTIEMSQDERRFIQNAEKIQLMRELVAKSCVKFSRFRWVLRRVMRGMYLTMRCTIPTSLEKLE